MNTKPTYNKAPDDNGPDMLISDPDQRRKVQRLLVAMVVALMLLWWIGLPALKQWLTTSNDADMIHRMNLLCYGLGIMLFATAGYAVWYARTILGSSQFPPPGTWVMRDTRLLRGDQARARGWWVMACAISFIMLGAFAMFVMPGHFEGLLKAGAMPVQSLRPMPMQTAPPIAKPHG